MDDFEIDDILDGIQFKNNPALRPINAAIPYTMEQLLEIEKCRHDPIYFIKNYINVVHPDRGIVLMDLYPYQERMIRAYHDNYRVIFLTARQQGKCLCINTTIDIRNKISGKLVKLTIGELYEWQAFRRTYDDTSMQEMRDRISSQE